MNKKMFLPILILVLIVSSLNSCKDKEFSFSYTLEEYTFCFAASAFTAGQEFDFIISQSDIETAFTQADASLSKIEAASLKGLKLVVTDSGNLDDIAGMQVYVREVGTTGNGEQIAHVDNIPNSATEIELVMNGTELKTWLTKEQFQLHAVIYNKHNGTNAVCLKLSGGNINVKVKE